MEEERGRRRHEQVSSGGDVGERHERGYSQEERNNASEGWSGERAEDLAGLETEEEAMITGAAEGVRETRTLTPWGTQDIGAGATHV